MTLLRLPNLKTLSLEELDKLKKQYELQIDAIKEEHDWKSNALENPPISDVLSCQPIDVDCILPYSSFMRFCQSELTHASAYVIVSATYTRFTKKIHRYEMRTLVHLLDGLSKKDSIKVTFHLKDKPSFTVLVMNQPKRSVLVKLLTA